MSRTQLTSGLLPTELGLLTKLSVLRLETNTLNGTTPTELGAMDASLETLFMGRNQLTGSLPTELGLLTNLLDLYLERNALSGIIPSEVGRADELIVLDLWRNVFTGTLPSELGRSKNLTFFTFERNELSGIIKLAVFGIQLGRCKYWAVMTVMVATYVDLIVTEEPRVHLKNAVGTVLSWCRDSSCCSTANTIMMRAMHWNDSRINNTSLCLPNRWLLTSSCYENQRHLNQLTGSLPTELGI